MKNLTTVYQFEFTSLEDEPIKLADYRGQVLLIVNTASKCGLARQYKDLQILQDTYHDQGFTIIGVSSQDFGNQEYTNTCEIKELAQKKFAITFPLTVITKVKCENAHPFYIWARKKTGFIGSPKWNFHKYLIGKDGQIIDWYSSVTPPTASKVTNAIEKALNLES